MNIDFLQLIFTVILFGCGGLAVKADDLLIGILVTKYRPLYKKAGRPSSVTFWDPVQDFINMIFNWRILFRGNYIDKSNKQLTELVFWYRFYYVLFFILLFIHGILYD
jgi:hypothetical protein